MSSGRIIFPRAFAFAVDDLGWNEGSDLSMHNPTGPYRAGINRNFGLDDYRHLVAVGKAVGARIQCLFILSEMDRTNILAKYPTATWQRDKWNNTHRVNERQQEIMKYVVAESGFMEFGLHGTGHEYWKADGMRRAEWYNLADRKPWPEEDLLGHINAFKEIMGQYDLTEKNGHSFPESFVPCAYSYYWNPDGHYSLGKLLEGAGVKYANTDFSQIPELNPPAEMNGGDFDFGTHVINRINYGNPWQEMDCLPTVDLLDQHTDIIESHWPNWLAREKHLQKYATAKWIRYYMEVQRSDGRYIVKNTEQLHSQWLYKKFARLYEPRPGTVGIDNSLMPEKAYKNSLLGNLVLKIKLPPGEHIASAVINNSMIPGYLEEQGFGFIYLPPLKKEKYTLSYTTGNSMIPIHVWNDGTFNSYYLAKNDRSLEITLKIYGQQLIKIKCEKPETVRFDNDRVVVTESAYDPLTGYLKVQAAARNMQGETGTLHVEL